MSRVSKYFYLLAAFVGGSLLSGGCLGGFPGAIFSSNNELARGLWLWLSEDLITH